MILNFQKQQHISECNQLVVTLRHRSDYIAPVEAFLLLMHEIIDTDEEYEHYLSMIDGALTTVNTPEPSEEHMLALVKRYAWLVSRNFLNCNWAELPKKLEYIDYADNYVDEIHYVTGEGYKVEINPHQPDLAWLKEWVTDIWMNHPRMKLFEKNVFFPCAFNVLKTDLTILKQWIENTTLQQQLHIITLCHETLQCDLGLYLSQHYTHTNECILHLG